MTVDELISVLQTRAGFETVKKNGSANQLRLIGRVPMPIVPNWLIIVQRLLLRNEDAAWSVDVSKSYFLKAGRVAFGWRLIFQAKGIGQYIPDIAQTIVNAPRPKVTVEEQPLAGASANRNRQTPGSLKGAAPTGKSVVGPVARQMLTGR